MRFISKKEMERFKLLELHHKTRDEQLRDLLWDASILKTKIEKLKNAIIELLMRPSKDRYKFISEALSGGVSFGTSLLEAEIIEMIADRLCSDRDNEILERASKILKGD